MARESSAFDHDGRRAVRAVAVGPGSAQDREGGRGSTDDLLTG